MEELFKPIPDTQERYWISNYGRILSSSFTHNYHKPHFIQPSSNGRGYLMFYTHLNGVRKHYNVHRLVATLFVKNPNPALFTEVNHIDENKLNNRADNLEWCNRSINMSKFWQNKHRLHIRGKAVPNTTDE